MEKMFCMGLAIGAVCGALLVANNYKARTLVKKSQSEVMQKLDCMMDEQLSKNGSDSAEKQGKSEQKSEK